MIEERRADIELNFGEIKFTEFCPDPEDGSIIAMQNLSSLDYRDVSIRVLVTKITSLSWEQFPNCVYFSDSYGSRSLVMFK